ALARDRALSWMLVYGAAIAASAVAAGDRSATLAALMGFLREPAIAFIMLNLLRTTAGLRLASWALVAGGVFLAAAGVIHVFTGYDLGGLSSLSRQVGGIGSTTRIDGPAGVDSNYFGQLLVTVVPLG